MEVTLSSQLLGLGMAALTGVALAAVYDMLRITRILFRTGRAVMYVQDILYGAIAALVTFLLALAVNSGEVRFYMILGEAAGMAAYFLTVGRLTAGIAKRLRRFGTAAALWCSKRIGTPAKAFYEKKKAAVLQKRKKKKKRKKNSEGNKENPLKPSQDMVYNQIKHIFIGSDKGDKGGIPKDDTKP